MTSIQDTLINTYSSYLQRKWIFITITLYHPKKLRCRPWGKTRIVIWTINCESLSRTSLPIGKYTNIISINSWLYQILHHINSIVHMRPKVNNLRNKVYITDNVNTKQKHLKYFTLVSSKTSSWVVLASKTRSYICCFDLSSFHGCAIVNSSGLQTIFFSSKESSLSFRGRNRQKTLIFPFISAKSCNKSWTHGQCITNRHKLSTNQL